MNAIVPRIALLALLALMGCSPNPDFSRSAYLRGIADAEAELADGRLALERFGYPPPWLPAYRRILRERHGIEERSVAGCVVDAEVTSHAQGFNEVMNREIRRKWPGEILDRAAQEAAAQYRQDD